MVRSCLNHVDRAFPWKALDSLFQFFVGGCKGAQRPRSAARPRGGTTERQEDAPLTATRRAEGMVPPGVHPCTRRPCFKLLRRF